VVTAPGGGLRPTGYVGHRLHSGAVGTGAASRAAPNDLPAHTIGTQVRPGLQ
jgi:hypothetical protein